MRQTQSASLDPASFPRQSATSMKPQIWANLRYLPSVQWLPPQPGQQTLTVRFHAAGRVAGGLGPPSKQKGGDISVEPSLTPGNGLGRPFSLATYSEPPCGFTVCFLFLVFISPCAK